MGYKKCLKYGRHPLNGACIVFMYMEKLKFDLDASLISIEKN